MPTRIIVERFMELLGHFVFWYPFIMSVFWTSGAFVFKWNWERKYTIDFNTYEWPKLSILIPCYNEENTIKNTIHHLSTLSYPDYEMIVVNDGSSDNTSKILHELHIQYPNLKIIDCKENKGKANALYMATFSASSEYLICVDSDAILSDSAPYYLMHHFIKNGERVGAVTGNPRVRNRNTLLSRIQLAEYSSIIGSIKRAQRTIGNIMTVSGVIVAFRKKALIDVGLWDRDIITEDIGVTWKLQRKLWDVRYEPRALCWMLVPETLSGLWKQRVRWAQGGQEVLYRHFSIFKSWKQRRLWLIYLEQVFSTLWSFSWFAITLYVLFSANSLNKMLLWFTFNSFALVLLSHIQLVFAFFNENRYDNIIKEYFVAAWYPCIYWMINACIILFAVPKAIHSRIKGGYATWNSPDRGNLKKPLP